MDTFDLIDLLLPTTLVLAPLTLRSVGGWAWAAWLPARLRALESRRALAFVERLVRIVAEERWPADQRTTVDEEGLMEEFVEAATGIARVLPDGDEECDRTAPHPVSDRLRAIATTALERALAPGLNGSAADLERRDRVARACLEILRKLPSEANTDVVRRALRCSEPAIVRQSTTMIAAAPATLRAAVAPSDDCGNGEHKVYRAR